VRAFLRLALLLLCAIAAEARSNQLRIVYVRIEASSDGADGTREHPFRRITDALILVRSLANEDSRQAFRIDVGPGVYTGAYSSAALAAHPDWEVLPLWVDVSHTEVRGSMHIESGLGRGEPLVLDTDTLLVVGERIQSAVGGVPTGSAQTIMVLGPTIARPEVTDVVARRLHFDGIFHDGVGVFVDRVADFAVEESVFERLATGTRSRGASGSWSHNYTTANVSGATLTGGSLTHPAKLNLVNDRCIANDMLGMLVIATGSYAISIDPGQSGLTPAPIQTVFDLSSVEDAVNVPDTFSASVLGGDYSDNGWIGFRLFEVGVRTNTYDTASLDQPIATHLDVRFSGNAFDLNGNPSVQPFGYGVSLDAGFPNRIVNGVVQQTYTGTYKLLFEENEFGGNLTASLFAGFTRFGISKTYKPLRKARIDIVEDATLDTVYDVPECDPFDLAQGRLDDEIFLDGVPVSVNAPFCPFLAK
jgi:hypothetical protein